MTASEPVNWSIDDVVDFLATDRHTFHLSTELHSYMTGEGRQYSERIRAVCSCGMSVTGLQNIQQVFELVKSHCEPL